jgi:hypothetical protein
MRKLRAVHLFVRWVLAEGGCSARLYADLLRILLHGRQSVYGHYRSAKAASAGRGPKAFLNSLASAQAHGGATVPARLLARLLRTIYLTEVLPRRDAAARRAGPNEGYAAHPQFSYGESLGASTRPKTGDGNLG